MTDRLRPWAGWQDLAAVHDVCSRRLLARPDRASVHPGDISWWLGWPPKSDDELSRRMTLWERGDETIGFAFLDDQELVTFVVPEVADSTAAAEFEDEVLSRAVRQVHGPMRWCEFEDEAAAVERWRARGFAPIDEGYPNFVRPLTPATDVPGSLAAPVTPTDARDRAEVTYAAFRNARPFEDYVLDYEGFMRSPAYPAGWDLLARDADGRAAACCIAWPDPVSGTGTFEPVATHPDLMRRGFARAVLQEGFGRLAEAGMRTAIVGTDLHNEAAASLYRSVGFVDDRIARIYERP